MAYADSFGGERVQNCIVLLRTRFAWGLEAKVKLSGGSGVREFRPAAGRAEAKRSNFTLRSNIEQSQTIYAKRARQKGRFSRTARFLRAMVLRTCGLSGPERPTRSGENKIRKGVSLFFPIPSISRAAGRANQRRPRRANPRPTRSGENIIRKGVSLFFPIPSISRAPRAGEKMPFPQLLRDFFQNSRKTALIFPLYAV